MSNEKTMTIGEVNQWTLMKYTELWNNKTHEDKQAHMALFVVLTKMIEQGKPIPEMPTDVAKALAFFAAVGIQTVQCCETHIAGEDSGMTLSTLETEFEKGGIGIQTIDRKESKETLN